MDIVFHLCDEQIAEQTIRSKVTAFPRRQSKHGETVSVPKRIPEGDAYIEVPL
jgi:hypothetical protein